MFLQRKSRVVFMLIIVAFCFAFAQVGQAAVSHQVVPGDTLWLISQRYNTTVAKLTAANRLADTMLYPGQVLSIPVREHTVVSGDTMFLIAQRYGISLPVLISANPNVSPTYIYPGQKIIIPNVYGSSVDSSSLPSRDGRNYSQQDIDLLARLVHAEAAGEPYIGQVAIAASVLNRVKSPVYPNTIRGVIYQVTYGYYQYSPVLDGRINLPANRTAYQAVYDALAGWDPSNGALGFYNPRKTSNQWVRQQTVTTVIGNHVFFR
ncbi:MAG: LysM peptidoglycan-binding domain-containing protein [Bacillota bacterium]